MRRGKFSTFFEVSPIDMNGYLGEATQTYENGDGSVLRSYAGKTKTEFYNVCAILEGKDYTLYSRSEKNGSLFATYTKGNELFHLYWTADDQRLNVVTSDTAATALPEKDPVTTGDKTTTITQLNLPLTTQNIYSNGMGYVIRLADGSFLVYDGGYAEQADQLYRTLVVQNGGADGIVIRAWLITHAHSDHFSCLKEFSTRYADAVTVETFLIAALNASDVGGNKFLHTEFPGIAARFAGAKVCTVHTGMTFRFCNLTMEILFAPDSLYINGVSSDFNNSGIVSRLFNEEDSILFLGDVMNDVTSRLVSIYGETLQTRQCQVAHHGVGNSPVEFYEYLKATTLWYPCGHKLYDWTSVFADNVRRNGSVRKALDESGKHEILLHDEFAYQRIWGSADAATPFSLT